MKNPKHRNTETPKHQQEAKLLAQGAEAKIYLNTSKNIVKDRTSKSYRHPDLDNKIRKQRTKREEKILIKAKALGINVPQIIAQNTKTPAHQSHVRRGPKHQNTDKFEIHLEFIKGDRLSQTLNSMDKKIQTKIMQKIAKQVSLLHENNIIHADLTTSNLILKQIPNPKSQIPQYKIYLIDFGLSYISTKIEDKAVDLHLIKQALEAKHYQNHEKLFKAFLSGYKWEDSKKIIERLTIVEKRGRYK